MSNNNNNHQREQRNGFHPYVEPVFREDNQQFPSRESEWQEDENYLDHSSQPLTEQGRENLRILRRFYISLIVSGLVVGGLLTWGIVTLLNEWNLMDPPAEQQLNTD
ncbi:hypothetical protein FRE64_08195 [Euhalothece natronophila Z-M001]|uniref:Uncharacterized protein n=1 Tax=Euhalothece natronophila Z-M001 TaxID=522448 RepID=A0A5B8NLJ9_9CHRO|nr:hypothetical protein [Euhalothece natronophila]QDZ39924.1 hypothetical protein FRE64_08195 [Euhalothece natronophila Z-M001]